MARQNYTVNISFGNTEPEKGKFSSQYSISYSGLYDNTTGFQSGSAINLVKRFAEYVALSGATNGAAISAAVNGLDSLGYSADF